jgi:hypothetical protein
MKSLRSFTSTLCELLNIAKPMLATEESYFQISGHVSKALIYCPDAFGKHAFKKFPEMLIEMQKSSTHSAELNSVFPSVTPVCFASLFSGGTPEQHGIVKYAKPVLKCDTFFDALIRAGKKVAIIAVKNSSIDIIFRERALDYFSVDYDPLVSAKALELLEKNEHDVIIVYHQEYDDLLHETGLFSDLAVNALGNHIQSWKFLNRAAEKFWKKDYCVTFAPDHGGHTDPVHGKGDHGDNSSEDMELIHFFTIVH